MTPVRLEPAALRSRVKHSTTEPVRSLCGWCCKGLTHLSQASFYGISTDSAEPCQTPQNAASGPVLCYLLTECTVAIRMKLIFTTHQPFKSKWIRLKNQTSMLSFVDVLQYRKCKYGYSAFQTILGECLLISALRTHVDSLGKPRDVNKRSQSLAW